VSEIEYLRMEWGKDIIELEKDEETGWTVLLPYRDRASDALVTRILSTWHAASMHPMVGLNKGQDQTPFGLTSPSLRVTLRDQVERFSFTVGTALPLAEGYYAQVGDDATIYSLMGDILEPVPTDLHAYRERALFSGTPEEVKRLEVRAGGSSIQCVRGEQGRWTLLQPLSGRGDAVSIQDFLDTLYAMDISSFVADQVSDPGIYSIDERSAEIRIYLKDQADGEVVRIGGPAQEEGTVYAADAGRLSVFTVPDEVLDLVSADVELFRDHRPVPFLMDQITGVRIQTGTQETRLEKDATTWRIFTPKPRSAAMERIESFLDLWTSPVIQEFLTATNQLSELELKAPLAEMEFITIDGEMNQSGVWSLRVYNDDREDSHRVHLVQDDVWVRLPSALLGPKLSYALSFYSLEVLNVDTDSVTGFSLDSSSATQNVVRSEAGVYSSDTGIVDAEQLGMLEQQVASLVALLPTAYFSKDVDRLTVHIRSSVGISRTLLLGNRTRTGSRYAKLLGDPVIYLLPRDSVELLGRRLVSPEKSGDD